MSEFVRDGKKVRDQASLSKTDQGRLFRNEKKEPQRRAKTQTSVVLVDMIVRRPRNPPSCFCDGRQVSRETPRNIDFEIERILNLTKFWIACTEFKATLEQRRVAGSWPDRHELVIANEF